MPKTNFNFLFSWWPFYRFVLNLVHELSNRWLFSYDSEYGGNLQCYTKIIRFKFYFRFFPVTFIPRLKKLNIFFIYSHGKMHNKSYNIGFKLKDWQLWNIHMFIWLWWKNRRRKKYGQWFDDIYHLNCIS